jgi:hypothetical protein
LTWLGFGTCLTRTTIFTAPGIYPSARIVSLGHVGV